MIKHGCRIIEHGISTRQVTNRDGTAAFLARLSMTRPSQTWTIALHEKADMAYEWDAAGPCAGSRSSAGHWT